MIGAIAHKELLTALRDGRVLWSAAIFGVMLIAALASAAQRYAVISAERAAAQAIVDLQWNNQGEKNPHAAAHYGVYAFKPVTPLSFFDTGVTSFTGVSIWLEAHKQNFAEGEPARDATAIARFGELTAAFTLQLLLPLLVILLSFGAFAGEREQGTLRQVLSTGVSSTHLLIGKALGVAGAIGLFVGPILVLGLLALVASPGGAGFLGHGLALMVLYIAYGLVFLFLTLAVSAAVDSARTALVVMIAFWAVSSVALPRAASDVARLATPTPTAIEFRNAVASDMEAGIGGKSLDQLIAERRAATLRLYKAQSVEQLPINFQGMVFALQEQMGNQVFDKHFGALFAAMREQLGTMWAFSTLSPRLAVQLASMELAGTSLASHEHFTQQAERHRRKLIETMNRAMTMNSSGANPEYRAGAELWSQVEPFVYAQEPLAGTLARLGPAITVMLLWLAGAVGAAVLAAQRLKVMAS
jgi:ABC-2 type transport system permease protein